MLLGSGCDTAQRDNASTKSEPAPTSTTETKRTEAAEIWPKQIEVFDASMRRSDTRMMTGDLRPIWVVSGRIKNNSPQQLAEVLLRITVVKRGTVEPVDEADLRLDTDIAPLGVSSFSRNVQLLPPQQAWEWDLEVIKGRAKLH